MKNKLLISFIIAALAVSFTACDFKDKSVKNDDENSVQENYQSEEEKTSLNTLPNTIDRYAKSYTDVGEVLPTKSLESDSASESTPVTREAPTAKEGMSIYTSNFGYTLEYPDTYTPKINYDGKEFVIIDEKSGSNLNVIITYPNILYESEDTYKSALEGNDEILLKSFEVKEINGINAVEAELAIQGGYVYQTIYRTGEYYYILSYVQGKGVTVDFDKDMKEILNSLKLL